MRTIQVFEATKHITNWEYVPASDLGIIHQPLQTLGINYYSSTHVKLAKRVLSQIGNPVPAQKHVRGMAPMKSFDRDGLESRPQALLLCFTEQLQSVSQGLPLFITETGLRGTTR